MTRALVWKEVREQGTVLVALVVLGAAVLIAASVLLDPTQGGRATELRSLTAAGRLGLMLLTLTAGLVVGGTLFAGEREAGTFAFLDMLPGSRWRVWWRKVLTGAGLVAGAVGVFLAVAFVGGIIDKTAGVTGWLLFGLVTAYAAYGWGVFGSVLARTSLAACGIGLAAGTFTGLFLTPLLGVALQVARREFGLGRLLGPEWGMWELAYLATGYTLVAIPLPIAAWLYTAPDRSRRLAALDVRLPGVRGMVRAGMGRLPRAPLGAGLRRLAWLTARQTGTQAIAVAAAALVAGCTLVPEEGVPTVIWPVLGVIAGVLAGVLGLADEQATGSVRFWAERRLPAGRLWAAKLAAGVGLTLAAVVMLLVPAVVTAAVTGRGHGSHAPFVVRVFRSAIVGEPGFPLAAFVLAWPAYGLAFGHLCALLFRKAVVAAAVALLAGGTFAAVWLPSMLSGGLHGWQVFAPVVLVLLTARLLTWAWVGDRIGRRGPLTRLAVAGVLVVAVTGGGIGYRVVEAPLVPDVDDDLRFAAELPTYDDKQPGRDLRRAVALLNEVDPQVRNARPDRPLAKEVATRRADGEQPFVVQLPAVFETGWPADRPDLDRWLDAMCAPGWEKVVEAAAAKPTGVLEDPAEYAPDSPLRFIDGARQLNALYLARGLQRQAAGDPAAFPRVLAVELAVVRTTRNDTLDVVSMIGRAMEFQAYQALTRWLERLDGRPDLLRAALAAVAEHDARDVFSPQRIQLAHQVVARNGIAAPGRWLPRTLDAERSLSRGPLDTPSPGSQAEGDLIGFAWAVPWEKERLRRVVGLGNRPGRWAETRRLAAGAPGWGLVFRPDPGYRSQLVDGEKLLAAARRAAMLTLAARLSEAEKGTLPAKLAELVPGYLPAVPADPYDGQPFRYRVSAGEEITQNVPHAQRTPDPPPGFQAGVTDGQYRALAALGGGLICWPLEPGYVWWEPPPGCYPRELTGGEVTSVSAVASGVVFWPQLPAWGFEPPEPVRAAVASVGPPAPPWAPLRTGATPRQETVPAGQGILWSIGPDRTDNAATVAVDPYAGTEHPGDLVYLIPRPARAAGAEDKP